MSDSLRDQRMKAGLTDEQSVRKTRSQKRKKRRQGESDTEQEAASQAAAQREADRRARDRTLNRHQQEAREQEAREKAARALVVDNEVAHDGDERFQFEHNSRIRPINVSTAQRKALATGQLAIARTRGRYRLIPGTLVERLRADAPFLLAWTAEDKPAEEESDDYPDHPVPDDLMW